jgi:hypothetical protein
MTFTWTIDPEVPYTLGDAVLALGTFLWVNR